MFTEPEIKTLREELLKSAARWQAAGRVCVRRGDTAILEEDVGEADREAHTPVTAATRYRFSGLSRHLVGLVYLALCERKTIRPGDRLDRYIPEYRHAGRITLRQLAQMKSGVPDHFYGGVMLALQKDPAHAALEERARFAREQALSFQPVTLAELLGQIGDLELLFEPGQRSDYSGDNARLLVLAMERAAGKPYVDLLRELIFALLGMAGVRFEDGPAAPAYGAFREKELVRLPELPVAYAFTADAADLQRLMDGLAADGLLNARSWKQARTFDEDGESVALSRVDGFLLFSLDAPGGDASFYFDRAADVRFCHISACGNLVEPSGRGSWDYFRRDLRDAVNGATTYPKNTRVVPYGPKNCRGAVALQIREDQVDFVSDATSALAYALAYRRSGHKAYVLQEGDRAIGLLILEVNPKKGEYWVDIVLIDKRYQGRGYGKIMVGWGVEELKRRGAKHLSIGVNRFNIPAQRLYASLGFQPAEVYEGGMMMRIDLE